MNEKMTNLLVIIIVILLMFVFGVFKKNKPSYEEEIENVKIKSVVRKKFINYSNHGIPYVVYSNDSIIISRNWEDHIAIGDSIIKPEGSTIITIKNLNKYIEFDYNNPH